MSTEGAVRRYWLRAEVYSETSYYDGDPSQTIRSHTLRAGRFELTFSGWPGGGSTHRWDWSRFTGQGLHLARTPWGCIEAYADDRAFATEITGDVPMGVENKPSDRS